MMEITRKTLGLVRGMADHNPALIRKIRRMRNRVQRLIQPFGLTIPAPVRQSTKTYQNVITSFDRVLYQAQGSPHVLFYSPRVWYTHLLVENILANALSLRGASCMFFTCAAHLPVCNITNSRMSPPMPCSSCIAHQNDIILAGGYPNYTTNQFLSRGIRAYVRRSIDRLSDDELELFIYEGLPLGKMVQISVRWFLAVNDIAYHPLGMKTYRDFLYGAILVTEATRRLLIKHKPDIIFMINGLFFEERIMLALAQRQSIPVVNYEVGFISDTYVFARHKLACLLDVSDHWDNYALTPLTREQDMWLNDYIADRQKGDRSLVQYWPSREDRMSEIKQRLHLPTDKKIAVLFTNLVWDTAVQEMEISFKNLFEWIRQQILFFEGQPQYHLVIRIHPAEIRLVGEETFERVTDRLQNTFPSLPNNVSLVQANSDISSYRLIELAHVVLVYTSTIGLEAALLGKTVLTAGKTHYRYKGFTLDTETQEAYFNQLRWVLATPVEDLVVNVDAARRYAYLVFKRYMVPFPYISSHLRDEVSLGFKTLDDLRLGCSPELDAICQFILDTQHNAEPTSLIIDR